VDLAALRVQTHVNGELRQDALLGEAAFQVPRLVSWISRIMTLEPGDLIATGTPSGIGPIVPWDEVEVTVAGIGSIRNPVRPAAGEPWPYSIGKDGS